jgi:hypothetical protein
MSHKLYAITDKYISTREEYTHIFQLFSVLFSDFDVHSLYIQTHYYRENYIIQGSACIESEYIIRSKVKEPRSKIISMYIKQSTFYGSHQCFCTISDS